MERKGRNVQQFPHVTLDQSYQNGATVTKIRLNSRSSNDADKGSRFIKILKKPAAEGQDLSTRSETRTGDVEERKGFRVFSLNSSKQKVIVERSRGRDEVTSAGHRPQIYSTPSAKPKTPRPGKPPPCPALKQKGDSGKIREKVTPHSQTIKISTDEKNHSIKPGGKTADQKLSQTSEKDTSSKPIKKNTYKKHHESGRRRSKPPQYPSEDDVNSTTKVLKGRGYLMEGKLGEGTYAKVRRAYSYHHNCRVAIKIVSRIRLNARFQQKFLPRELEIIRTVHHPHIIELLEMFENNGVIFLVMELAHHGDLLEYVQKKHALRDSEARTVFGQILSAVDYLHVRSIFHRDLKCENVLLEWGPMGIVAKITDFGFARGWSEATKPCTTYCGSAAYASPEILQAIPYDPHWADIWSLGVVLYIMVTGRMPFDDSNIKEALEDMQCNRLNFSRRRLVCIEVQRLLRAILSYSPLDRPTTRSIKNSPWMRGRCTMAEPSARLSASVGGV